MMNSKYRFLFFKNENISKRTFKGVVIIRNNKEFALAGKNY